MKSAGFMKGKSLSIPFEVYALILQQSFHPSFLIAFPQIFLKVFVLPLPLRPINLRSVNLATPPFMTAILLRSSAQ